jgi:acetyl-CoA C-acetyltransferase
MTEVLYSNVNDNTPVLVGCAQYVDKSGSDGKNFLEILDVVARKAIEDCNSQNSLVDELDNVTVIRFVADTPNRDSATNNMWGYSNMPKSLSNSVGACANSLIYTTTGGNSPQLAVNEVSKRINDGNIDCALIAGGEALDTFTKRLKSGLEINWTDHPGGEPEIIGSSIDGANDHEKLYGIFDPSAVYPLFANALRAKEGTSPATHMDEISELFSEFSKVASNNEYAWFPIHRSAEEIAEIKPENRVIGYPYTKYMNSIMRVNQSSALIMTSARKAKEMGIPKSKWVFMHAGACLNDIWHMSDRVNYHSSPAIKACTDSVFERSNTSQEKMDFLDIYSCFPSAVQIAINELGIDIKDPRGLTVTGGLPYFGGPGNSYVLNAMASMIKQLRNNPGKFGLVTANGWYLTKHGAGIFSTKPVDGEWNQVVDTKKIQENINSMTKPAFTRSPEGEATVETYTVVHAREGAYRAIVIGRLNDGTRFLSNTEKDETILNKMMQEEMLGATGTVSFNGKRNIFRPN